MGGLSLSLHMVFQEIWLRLGVAAELNLSNTCVEASTHRTSESDFIWRYGLSNYNLGKM